MILKLVALAVSLGLLIYGHERYSFSASIVGSIGTVCSIIALL